ncbi:site-specific recombinase, phage integrase family [Faecalibacterium cf. prausnitzii KLE1255]|uniref:Site-specific recombinase, phage integrase family n=2 Tax=Oscillospiraceae TaxID=216572 RepID=E2ZF48_9FIRM|nr:site-specific recombinase, phage integrase family [Faecalibacterium cf. prausnitzii KLE1255]
MLRRICKYAAHFHLIRPFEIMVKLPQKSHKVPLPFTTEEQKKLQTFVMESPTSRKIGLLLGFQLGLRIGEICGLKWGDFDLSEGVVTIQRTVTRISCGNGHTKVVVQSPKTQNSHREIPLPKSLLRVLKKLSKDFSSGTWFLSGNEEKPVEPRCYRKSIHGYLKKASVHQAHPHALRHTFATTCLQAHCDIKTLSELLGHSDAAVTLKKYVHSDMKRKRREINRVFENF